MGKYILICKFAGWAQNLLETCQRTKGLIFQPSCPSRNISENSYFFEKKSCFSASSKRDNVQEEKANRWFCGKQ